MGKGIYIEFSKAKGKEEKARDKFGDVFLI